MLAVHERHRRAALPSLSHFDLLYLVCALVSCHCGKEVEQSGVLFFLWPQHPYISLLIATDEGAEAIGQQQHTTTLIARIFRSKTPLMPHFVDVYP